MQEDPVNSLESQFSGECAAYARTPADLHPSLSMPTGSLVAVPPGKDTVAAPSTQQLCNSTRGQHCSQPESVQNFPEEQTGSLSSVEDQAPAKAPFVRESSCTGSAGAKVNSSEPSDVLPSASAIVMCSDQDRIFRKIKSQSQTELSDLHRLVSTTNGEPLSTGTKTAMDKELTAVAATEIQMLKDTIRRLKEENDALKAALRDRETGKVTSNVCASPPQPSSGSLVCLPLTPSAILRNKQDGDYKIEEETGKPKAKRCKAPGAPPRIRPPQEKLPVAHPAQSKRGEESANSTSRGSQEQWGWCLSGEPVSSLRSCCTDHLLFEGTCGSGEVTSRRSSEGSPSARPMQEVAKGLVEVPWLLNLEETFQVTLTDPQCDQTEDLRKPPRSGFSRDALKSLIDEIGFSVLEVEIGKVEWGFITEDPRLAEWFVRPKQPTAPSRNTSSAEIISLAFAPAAGAGKRQRRLTLATQQTKEATSLPASLRKSISISLSALRRGCRDRLNFLKQLRADILQCSLSTSTIELMLELVPNMTVASDRRQLWLDARNMLKRICECGTRPLDDEEAFTAFVFEFGSFHGRLEVLNFLNRKHLEAQISSLLVQVQLKLDCLAMLRRRAPKLSHCVKAVALAASVVCGTTLRLPSEGATAEVQGKENRELSAKRKLLSVTDTTGDGQHTPDSLAMFRWPLLFQMVERHCGYSADGSLDRSRSLLKVLAPHIGKTLDSSEVALLKRAAQNPVAAVLEHHTLLSRSLLLLHCAACQASSKICSSARRVHPQSPEESMKTLATRLQECLRSRESSSARRDVAEEAQSEEQDLLLAVIPKLVMAHKDQLETLARLVAQLLREYAAFVCWMGDRHSFLPVQLPAQVAGSEREQQGGHFGLSLPALLVPCLAPPSPQRGDGHHKFDAFECLSAFFDKLSHHVEPSGAERIVRKHFLDIKGLANSRGPSTLSYTTSSSLIGDSPRSLLATRKPQHHASTAYLRERKVRSLALPVDRDEGKVSGHRTLMPHASASVRCAVVSESSRSSGLPGNRSDMQLQGTTSLLSRVFCVGPAEQAERPQGTTPTTQPFSDYSATVLFKGRDNRVVSRRNAQVSTVSPEELISEPEGKQMLVPTSSHLLDPNSSRSMNEAARSAAANSRPTRVASQHWSPEVKQSFVHVNLEEGIACAVNPLDFTKGAFASVLSSKSASTPGQCVSLENVPSHDGRQPPEEGGP